MNNSNHDNDDNDDNDNNPRGAFAAGNVDPASSSSREQQRHNSSSFASAAAQPPPPLESNNNNDNNNNDNSQLQQLLSRLSHHAPNNSALDPIQGQFLLDASGGDLDLAMALFWEDSVAYAASAVGNANADVNVNVNDAREHGHQHKQWQGQNPNANGGDNDNDEVNGNDMFGNDGNNAVLQKQIQIDDKLLINEFELERIKRPSDRYLDNADAQHEQQQQQQQQQNENAVVENVNPAIAIAIAAGSAAGSAARVQIVRPQSRRAQVDNSTSSTATSNNHHIIRKQQQKQRRHQKQQQLQQKQPQLTRRDIAALLHIGSGSATSAASNGNGSSDIANIRHRGKSNVHQQLQEEEEDHTTMMRKYQSVNNSENKGRSENYSSSTNSIDRNQAQMNEFIREVSKRGINAPTAPFASSSTNNNRNDDNSSNNNNNNNNLNAKKSSRELAYNNSGSYRRNPLTKQYEYSSDNKKDESMNNRRQRKFAAANNNNDHDDDDEDDNNDDNDDDNINNMINGGMAWSYSSKRRSSHGNDPPAARAVAARNADHDEEEQEQERSRQRQRERQLLQIGHVEASNVSDDEVAAAAIAERLWKQIKPDGISTNNNRAYKFAIQKQIQKMTRKRKKKREMLMYKEDEEEGGGKRGRMDDGDETNFAQENNELVNSASIRSSKMAKLQPSHSSNSSSSNKGGKRKKQNDDDSMDYYLSSDENDEYFTDDSDNDDTDGTHERSKSPSQWKEILEEKYFTLEKMHAAIYQCKQKSKKKDRGTMDSNLSDGGANDNESELESVNIDDFEDAFNLPKYKNNSVTPSQVLWGGEHNNNKEIDESIDNGGPDDDAESNDENENIQNNDNNVNNRNETDAMGKENENQNDVDVISNGDANEENEENADNDNEEEDDNDERSGSESGLFDAIIPRTWLSAGFQLSKCGTGLVLPQPSDSELARLKRIQTSSFPRGTTSIQPPLPPYHCGGITVLLSIVTALIYTGASIQGKEVNCNSRKRKPFAELTVAERNSEFAERLGDALSALLFIASTESTNHRLATLSDVERRLNRKHKALKKQKLFSMDDDAYNSNIVGNDLLVEGKELCMKQMMHHRVKLCQVCHWEVDTNTKELKIPLDSLIDNDEFLRFSLTRTNHKDLRSFVWSNVRSFMGPGGCALFLETLVHIHGIARLTRILNQLRGGSKKECLIRCNCEENVKSKWEESLRKYKETVSSNNAVSAPPQSNGKAPPGNNCISDELISLLISGKAEYEYKALDTSKLGFGLVSIDDITDTDLMKIPTQQNLQSTSKTIWLVKGSKSYSVLWNNEKLCSKTKKKQQHQLKNDIDKPFHLSFWNSWVHPHAEIRHGKIIPLHHVPRPQKMIRTHHSKEEKQANPEATGNECQITDIQPHPEDVKLYKNYRHWRFSVINSSNSRMGDEQWISYFRLNERQKTFLELKMAPQINKVIWSLWPGSEIEWSPSMSLIC